MIKRIRKSHLSITNIILITCISILIVPTLIMGSIMAIIDTQFIATVRDNILYSILVAGMSLGAAVIVYFVLIKRVLKSFDNLIETTKRFGNGDLSQRAIVVRNDEIGMLTTVFNSMADTIHGQVNDLEERVKIRTLELAKAKERMRDSRNRLRLILDSTGEGIYGMDTQGKCTFCNTSSLEILGYSHYSELIGQMKRMDRDENLPISIIYGDVNGLKLLNDMHGHEKGDELLKKTGEVLTRVSREGDIVSRVGGDEFVILLANTEARDAEMIIQRIKSELSNEKIAGIKGSITLALSTKTSPDQDIDSVLRNAEAEMYKAKTLDSKNVNSGMLKNIMESLYENSQREKLHSINVSCISEDIAINIKLPETDVRRARDAGFYHDIGKIILDKDILNKKDELDNKEMEEMEHHPLIGFRILNLFNETLDIAQSVLTHHERWDGSGYPKGLKGEEIPVIARIIAVAEGYDVMINKAGGNGFTHEEAVEEIKSKAGTKYDPLVVASFVEINNKINLQ